MILKYEFLYKSSNHILSYFLNFYAKQYNIKTAFYEEDNKVIFFTNGDENDILAFNDECMPKIPHFIFLKDFKVEVCEDLKQGEVFEIQKYPNITPKVAQLYNDSSQISKNEFDILSEISVFMDNKFINVDENNFYMLLEFCLNALKNSQKIVLQDAFGTFEINNGVSFDSDFLMPTNLKEITKIFIADDKAQFALASFEKPMINLRINAIYRKNHENSPYNFWVKGARDLFTYVLCDQAHKINILFFSIHILNKTIEPFKVNILENSQVVLSSTYYLNKKIQDMLNSSKQDHPELLIYAMNINKKGILSKQNLLVLLNKHCDDKFLILDDSNSINLLQINIPDTYEKIIESIKQDETGTKLIKNFKEQFSLPSGKIKGNKNFFTLFEIVKNILGFDLNILQNADAYSGKKGPMIDYKLIENIKFDYIKFIKSGMSFKLAGVDDKTLSFGYIESFVMFINELFTTAKDEYDIFDIDILGSFLECKSFCALCKLHLNMSFDDELPVML